MLKLLDSARDQSVRISQSQLTSYAEINKLLAVTLNYRGSNVETLFPPEQEMFRPCLEPGPLRSDFERKRCRKLHGSV